VILRKAIFYDLLILSKMLVIVVPYKRTNEQGKEKKQQQISFHR
jgi:hypothetical protein